MEGIPGTAMRWQHLFQKPQPSDYFLIGGLLLINLEPRGSSYFYFFPKSDAVQDKQKAALRCAD